MELPYNRRCAQCRCQVRRGRRKLSWRLLPKFDQVNSQALRVVCFLQIPMDVMWLDIEYSKDHMYGVWDEVAFNNPERMLDGLDAKGRKVSFGSRGVDHFLSRRVLIMSALIKTALIISTHIVAAVGDHHRPAPQAYTRLLAVCRGPGSRHTRQDS